MVSESVLIALANCSWESAAGSVANPNDAQASHAIAAVAIPNLM
jgi:hypothetical protein